MKYLTTIKTSPFLVHCALLLVRVFVGFAMLTHGYPKLQQLLTGDEIKFFDFLGLGPKLSLSLAVFAEFVCSIFLILGLFTRPAIFFLMTTMVVAGVIVHASDDFSTKETSLLYLSVFVLLFAFGPGKYSVDGMISKRKETKW